MTLNSIVFAGTPPVAAQLLNALIEADLPVTGVFTQPDRASGRGRHVQSSAVKILAEYKGLPVFQPENFKSPEDRALLQALKPDILIVMAYGLILPRSVLQIPRLGCINIHTSLLPAYRGAAPVQRAILAGDAQTGVTLIQMEPQLDTGPILLQKQILISNTDTSETLLNKLGQLAQISVLEFLHNPQAYPPQAQIEAQASDAAKITAQEAELDWHQSAQVLDRAIRAYQPWPVAFKYWNGSRLRIMEAEPVKADPCGQPGDILALNREGLLIQTGEGQLLIKKLQFPGKKVLDSVAIANGYRQVFKIGPWRE